MDSLRSEARIAGPPPSASRAKSRARTFTRDGRSQRTSCPGLRAIPCTPCPRWPETSGFAANRDCENVLAKLVPSPAATSDCRVRVPHSLTPKGRMREVFDVLRRAPATVNEIADQLGLTHNAVRVHLRALEHEGLVRAGGRRHSGTRPAVVYEVVPRAMTWCREPTSRSSRSCSRCSANRRRRRNSPAVLFRNLGRVRQGLTDEAILDALTSV